MSDETEGKRVPGFEDEQAEFGRSRDAPAHDAKATEILRARPVKAEVDHEALSREFIRRFPKLRAALAK